MGSVTLLVRSFKPDFRCAVLACGPNFTIECDAAMGAWPYPQIVAVVPISQIVARFLPGGSVIRDFIGGQTGRRECVLSLLEHGRAVGLVGQPQITARLGQEEGCARLDGQLVDRDMAARQRERPVEFAHPGIRCLAGPCIDQVEGEPFEDVGGGCDCGAGLADCVGAAEC